MGDLYAHLTDTFTFKDLYKINPYVILVHGGYRFDGHNRLRHGLIKLNREGMRFSSPVWLPFAKALQRDYNVWIFDHPRFGTCQDIAQLDVKDPDVNYAVHGDGFAALYAHRVFSSTNRPHAIAHVYRRTCDTSSTFDSWREVSFNAVDVYCGQSSMGKSISTIRQGEL